MSKLTVQQANDILRTAMYQVSKGKSYDYRLGQAIFNLLPKDTADIIDQTPNDFFYWLDKEKVLEVFWNELVEM